LGWCWRKPVAGFTKPVCSMSTKDLWLPTPAASIALGCSQNHLKRSRETHGGMLEGGIDYALGSSINAPITWNVERCRVKFHRQGLMVRKASELLRAERMGNNSNQVLELA